MTTPTTPLTLLEAVNTLLRGIRVATLTTLTDAPNSEDSVGALQAIEQVNREFQMEGWFFNTVTEKAIDPEVSGEVLLPANTLKVNSARWKYGDRLTQRGLRLYNPKEGGTFILSETCYVDLVECLDFDDLSSAAKAYVTGTAARRFCIPKLPANATFQWTEDIVRGARRAVEQEDHEQRDQDLGDTSPHFAKHRRR